MKNYITVIKSVGYSADSGEVLDDSQGLMEFVEFVEDEDTSAEVTFEEGLKELKKYMLNCNAEEEDINEVESKLLALKEKVGFKGVWRTWGVEYDMSLATIGCLSHRVDDVLEAYQEALDDLEDDEEDEE